MTFATNIQGGTGAGRKMPGLKEKPAYIKWRCTCQRDPHPYYLARCWVCGAERPK